MLQLRKWMPGLRAPSSEGEGPPDRGQLRALLVADCIGDKEIEVETLCEHELPGQESGVWLWERGFIVTWLQVMPQVDFLTTDDGYLQMS